MFKLLDRFAWILSIALWLSLSNYLYSFLWLDISWTVSLIVISIIIWVIFKFIFLSRSFIEQRVGFFRDALFNKNNIEKPETKVDRIDAELETKNQDLPETNEVEAEYNEVETEKHFDSTIDTIKEKTYKKEPSIISKFFSENLLAKLWGILVFLWVLFFLSLVYNAVWPVAKIIIWFALWFALFITWVWLDKRWLYNESKILIWVAILVNYLVILSWRYLLWNDWYLSEWVTFLFLILNTIFAVLASLIYRSQVLLIFSFVFAYLNPLLIWWSYENPYTLLWYTIIVSFWAFFLSYKQKSLTLLILSFLFWNLLIFIAPISDYTGYLTSIIALNIFNLMAVWSSISFKEKYKHILEWIFWGIFFLIATFPFISYAMNYVIPLESMYLNIFLLSGISSMLFFIISYILSKKATYLYSIWTIWGILTLSPLISTSFLASSYIWDDIYIKYSIIFIAIFAILNWLVPFINKSFINIENQKSTINLFIWSIFGAMFLWVNIYIFWEKYFPWLMEWIAFLWLAVIYFIQSLLFIKRYWVEQLNENENLKNIFYNFIWISISLFSISVVFIFSKYPEIISTLWLFEATLLFYFFSKTRKFKIYLISIVLFIIWILKLWLLIDVVESWDFSFLISFIIIFLSFVLNIKFLSPRKNSTEGPYEIIHWIGHILWIAILSSLLFIIIPSTGHGWFILWISIFIFLLSFIYSYFSSKFLKWFFILVTLLFVFLQISELNSILWMLGIDNLEYLKILQYTSTLIIIWSLFIWKKFNIDKWFNTILNIIVSVYLLIITSLYIYDIFSNTFAVTIYWGIISSLFLFYWISKDLIKYRTLWLYLVSLTAFKIFFYDIWFGIDDAIMRVLALIIIWVLFIFISTRYTKRFWNNMSGEFNLKNLKK